jgi:hypothetical protein
VPLQNASATYEQTGAADGNPYKKWAVEAAIDGDAKGAKWGWAIMEKAGQPNFAVFETASDLTLKEGATLTITLAQNLDNPGHNLGCFRSQLRRPLDRSKRLMLHRPIFWPFWQRPLNNAPMLRNQSWPLTTARLLRC